MNIRAKIGIVSNIFEYLVQVEILDRFKILPYVCQGGFWMYDRQISKGKL